jgi:hypothetical protein
MDLPYTGLENEQDKKVCFKFITDPRHGQEFKQFSFPDQRDRLCSNCF